MGRRSRAPGQGDRGAAQTGCRKLRRGSKPPHRLARAMLRRHRKALRRWAAMAAGCQATVLATALSRWGLECGTRITAQRILLQGSLRGANGPGSGRARRRQGQQGMTPASHLASPGWRLASSTGASCPPPAAYLAALPLALGTARSREGGWCGAAAAAAGTQARAAPASDHTRRCKWRPGGHRKAATKEPARQVVVHHQVSQESRHRKAHLLRSTPPERSLARGSRPLRPSRRPWRLAHALQLTHPGSGRHWRTTPARAQRRRPALRCSHSSAATRATATKATPTRWRSLAGAPSLWSPAPRTATSLSGTFTQAKL
mmetsp:Transcript_36324/g.91744  ORF Transcript_36324/g.91744 Transcript_36324/m.91744 type:complete len:317 (+) Transcript_36324:909-1859(+)